MKRLARALGAIVAVGVAAGVVCLVRSPIRPAAYHPQKAPRLLGVLGPNRALQSSDRIAEGAVSGPETVVADAAGRLYAGNADGSVVRVDPVSGDVRTLARTGGRPLGMRLDSSGRLLIADGVRGLLALSPDGQLSTLATEVSGQRLGFADDLDVANDGTVYFSDATIYGVGDYMLDLLDGRPHGRLLRYDPTRGKSEVLLSGLRFANGVALASDESFVLVNETYGFRITRYWLKGPRAGTSDVFLDNLPGFPDGISSNHAGTFWLALFTVRNPLSDSLQPHPLLKQALAGLPRLLWPGPKPYGLVLALDEQGRVIRSLHDPGGRAVSGVTAAHEHGGALYLGSLTARSIGRVKL